VKQDEMKSAEQTDSSGWEAPVLEEIDIALLTRLSDVGIVSDGIFTS
jgi:hypothetical protein